MSQPVDLRATRILLVCEPGKNGVFEHAAELATHLLGKRSDLILDLAYSSRRSCSKLFPFVDQIRQRGGEAVDLQIENAPECNDLPAARTILRLVREHRPQIVHAHSSKAGALCRGLAALWSGFPPVVYTANAYYGMAGTGLRAAVYNAIESAFGRVGKTINVSKDEYRFARHVLHIPRRRLVVINNGVDISRFHPATTERKRACRRQLGLPEDKALLVSVGRDSAQKHYAPLYRSLDILLPEFANALSFAHAGEGSTALAATLSPTARAQCVSFEHLPDVETLLNAADGFVLTSRYEGLSLAVLQALACGLKTFLTRVPGNRCFAGVGLDEIGWIEPDDSDAVLQDRITAALRPWMQQPAAASPRQFALMNRHLNGARQFDKIVQVYNRLIRD